MLSEEFLIERGYCCGHGCLMCPYVPRHTKGNKVMRKNILIVSALEIETQGQLDDYNVLYTGVGKVNATIKLMERLGSIFLSREGEIAPNLVINYGTAGSQHWKYRKGDLVDCTRFVQRDMDVSGLGFKLGQTPFEKDIPIIIQSGSDFNPIGKNVLCGSGDSFVTVDQFNWKNLVDVVDMEAYALAKVCLYYGLPFISFKYITDEANGGAGDDWEENVGKGIVEFKKKVLDKLPKSS